MDIERKRERGRERERGDSCSIFANFSGEKPAAGVAPFNMTLAERFRWRFNVFD